MTVTHAVVWTDHQTARVLQLDAADVHAQKVRAASHYTRQHQSGVRTEHEFFGHVCDALNGVGEVIVTGSRTAVADFKHYAEKHRPHAAARIVAFEIVDRPTDPELVALARELFLKHSRMVDVTKPSRP